MGGEEGELEELGGKAESLSRTQLLRISELELKEDDSFATYYPARFIFIFILIYSWWWGEDRAFWDYLKIQSTHTHTHT